MAVVESTLLRTIEDSFCWAWWRQQKKHGEASKSNGDVTRNNTPRPKNADTTYQNEKIGLKRYVLHKVTLKKKIFTTPTCVLCQTTEILEWPKRLRHGPKLEVGINFLLQTDGRVIKFTYLSHSVAT